MNKYNIQIGDYVETADGAIGYVNRVGAESFSATLVQNGSLGKVFSACELFVQFCTLEDNNSIIKQIGADKFHKGQKPKLACIEKIIGDESPVCAKLNELIDHVNAIQEMLVKENKQ